MANFAQPVASGVKALLHILSKRKGLAVPVAGTLAGAGMGAVGAHTAGEAIDKDFTSSWKQPANIAASALAGLALSTGRGRKALFRTFESSAPIKATTASGQPVNVHLPPSRVPVTRALAVSTAPVAALPLAISAPSRAVDLGHKIEDATNTVGDLTRQAKEVSGKVEEIKRDWGDKLSKPGEIIRDIGVSSGAGLAGYFGGKALGSGIAGLFYPDEEKLSYEDRRKREKKRDWAGVITGTGLSLAASIAAPAILHKLIENKKKS
jgi:hypothetical protein